METNSRETARIIFESLSLPYAVLSRGHQRVNLERVGCRTVSRFLYPCGRQSFILAGHCCPALATYPEVERDGQSLLPYLVLLRVGFSLPAGLLPPRCALTAPFHPYRLSVEAEKAVYFLWHFPSSPCEPARPLAGTLPCGDRTFLSLFRERLPIRQPTPIIVALSRPLCIAKHWVLVTKRLDLW